MSHVPQVSHLVKVHKDKLTVTYNGKANHNHDVGAVQSNRAFSHNVVIGYFEMTILNPGERACMAIGFFLFFGRGVILFVYCCFIYMYTLYICIYVCRLNIYVHVYRLYMHECVRHASERWGAGVEYRFQEFNEPYAPS